VIADIARAHKIAAGSCVDSYSPVLKVWNLPIIGGEVIDILAVAATRVMNGTAGKTGIGLSMEPYPVSRAWSDEI